jgi:hypothetical protein
VSIVERAKNICLTPTTEWPVIAAEPTSPATLVTGYVVPLAAIGAIAGFIGGSIIGHTLPYLGTYRTPFFSGLVLALFLFCMAIVGVFVLSLVINALAPTFGGEQNSTQALHQAWETEVEKIQAVKSGEQGEDAEQRHDLQYAGNPCGRV